MNYESPASAEWLSEIARSADCDVEDVKTAFKGFRIPETVSLSVPSHIVARRISFAGTKKIKDEFEEFSFDLKDLDNGVFGILSYGDDGNFVGKTSIVGVLLWSLTGRASSKSLTEIVRHWIERVQVDFDIDGKKYSVAFSAADNNTAGELSLVRDSGSTPISKFENDAEFEAVMEAFMMEAFNLEPIPYTLNGKSEVQHSWPAYAASFFLGRKGGHLLGDEQWGGLPGRLLQMYAGIPYASHLMSIRTAKKLVENSQKERKSQREIITETNKKEIVLLEQQLSDLKTALNEIQQEEDSADKLSNLIEEQRKLTSTHSVLQQRYLQAENSLSEISMLHKEDLRKLLHLEESSSAQKFFAGLAPTVCPRCETPIDEHRHQEEEESSICSVCHREGGSEDSDILEANIAEVKNSIAKLEEAKNAATNEKADIETKIQDCRDQFAQNTKEIKSLQNVKGKLKKQTDLQIQIARTEGILSEKNSSTRDAEDEEGLDTNLEILKAAEKITDKRLKASKDDFLNDLNAEISRLAIKFGMSDVEQVALTHNAQLKVTIGGVATSFTKLQPGQRLRMRIATILAILRIAETKGIGRYPGLMIVDSPGAQETSQKDLQSLISELTTIHENFPSIQLFIASAQAELVEEYFDAKHRIVAQKGEFLW